MRATLRKFFSICLMTLKSNGGICVQHTADLDSGAFFDRNSKCFDPVISFVFPINEGIIGTQLQAFCLD